MPTYEYECQACGHRFEEFQSITADPIRQCPSCKKLKVKRLIGTGSALLFKGEGFYETDYRSDSYKKSAEAEKKAATESTGSAKSSSASDANAKSSGASGQSSSTGKNASGTASSGSG